MEPLSSKIMTVDQSGLWIDALVPAPVGDPLWPSDIISFQFSEVGRLQSLGPKHSILTLKNGPEIILDVPLAALREKIQDATIGTLDLKPFVNLSPKAEIIKSIRQEFAEAADADKWKHIESLTITSFIRQSQGKEFKPFTFKGSDIFARRMEEGGSIFGDKNLRLKLRPGKTNPFGTEEFIIETTIDEFDKLCRAAFQTGTGRLDMSDYSMRKGTVPKDEKMAAQPPLRP